MFSVAGSFQSLKGMSLDSQGNAWIASGGEGVYLVSPDGTEVKGPFTGGGISGPWSVTVDGDDNVWVANFGPMESGNFYGNDDNGGVKAAISKLAGVNTPGLDPGYPISPVTGYTLPSAGSQVLLHNSDPTKSDPSTAPTAPRATAPSCARPIASSTRLATSGPSTIGNPVSTSTCPCPQQWATLAATASSFSLALPNPPSRNTDPPPLKRAAPQEAGRATATPMLKQAFPGPPPKGLWMQLQGPLRNPYFGAEMSISKKC